MMSIVASCPLPPTYRRSENVGVREYRTTGFTLVELLVALVLGLTLISGALMIFVANNRSFIQDEQISRMQENGRYVMRLLNRDLAMAGFWGKLLDTSVVTNHISAVIGTDCGAPSTAWVLTLSPLEFLSNATATTTAANFDCIDSTTIVSGADIIAVKRMADSSTADGDIVSNQMYIKTNMVSGNMFLGGAAGTPPTMAAPAAANWAYSPRIYYLRNYAYTAGDNIPTLCQAYLSSAVMTTNCLVEGIENMQIEFGIDEDGDFIADYYTAAPSATLLTSAVSARIFLLVRSITTVPSYTNDKTYFLGTQTVAAANDRYYRRVYSSSVVLRNPSNLTGLDQ